MEEKQEKIRYRLVFNRSGRLNRKGEGLVQVECQQGRRRIYFSTKVYLEPRYWRDGMVVDHELATDLNIILRRMRIDIERVELDFMKRHTFASLLLEEGVPVTTVQRMLGHTKVQTTQIYAEVTERTIEKDVRRLAGKPQRGKRR